jgi:hypothetical protein
MPVKQARTVRATAAATAATTIAKYNINLTLLLLFFALCCSFFNYYSVEYRTTIDQNKSNRYRGTVQ